MRIRFLAPICLLALPALTACGGPPPPHVARHEIQADLKLLDKALTRFATKQGRFAGDLEELVNMGEVEREHTLDPYGRRYAYLPASAGQHKLLCYGEDGRPGGEGGSEDMDLASLRSRRY